MVIEAKEIIITGIDKVEPGPSSATIEIPIADSDDFNEFAVCLLVDNLIRNIFDQILKDNELNIDDLSRFRNVSNGTVEIFYGDDMLAEIFEPVYVLGNILINYRKFY